MNTIALIPAWCPDEHLIPLEKELQKLGMKICLVDDGSPAQYDGIFRNSEAYATVLHQRPHQGKGAALKYGMRFILDQVGTDCTVVTLDADGQHTAEDAARCAEDASEHPQALVLGTRYLNRKTVPLHNRMGNELTAALFFLSTGSNIKDTQTGLRAFNGRMMPFFISISGKRYEYEMNQLLECTKKEIPFREVEIDTIYGTCSHQSHFHVLRDSFLIYQQLFHFAASSFTSFLLDYGLFALFTMFLPAVSANILARLFSATFNYEVNRTMVFHDESSRKNSLLKYAVLAAGILVVNTLLLNLLVNAMGVNEYVAKLLVEVTMFAISWTIQKCFVFPVSRRIAG
jgi:putative flippase GtrA